jgi:hypothetical protein
MLIWEWDLSSRYGLVPKKSCKKSILVALSEKGTPEIGRTGTPITELMSWGSIKIVWPLIIVCMISPLSSS